MIEILTTVLVLITGAYVWITYRILQANRDSVTAMKQQIAASLRPFVVFDIVTDGPLLEMRIKNLGKTPAHGLKVDTTPSLFSIVRGHHKPAKITHFEVALLVPEREVREIIGAWHEFEAIVQDLRVSGRVRYSDASGQLYDESFLIDLSAYKDMAYIGRSEVRDELRRISGHLEDCARALKK